MLGTTTMNAPKLLWEGNCFIIDEQGESSSNKRAEQNAASEPAKKKSSFQEKLIGVKAAQIELYLTRYRKFLAKEETWQLGQMTEESNKVRHDQKLLTIDQRRNEIFRSKMETPERDFTFEENALTNLEKYLNKNISQSCYLDKRLGQKLRYKSNPDFIPPVVMEARKAMQQKEMMIQLQRFRSKSEGAQSKHGGRLSRFHSKSVEGDRPSQGRRFQHHDHTSALETHRSAPGDAEDMKLEDVTDQTEKNTPKTENTDHLLPSIEQVADKNKPNRRHLVSTSLDMPKKLAGLPAFKTPIPVCPINLDDDEDEGEIKTDDEIHRIMQQVLNMTTPEGEDPVEYKPRPKTIATMGRRDPTIPHRKTLTQAEVKQESRSVNDRLENYFLKLERQRQAAEQGILGNFAEEEELRKASELQQIKKKIVKSKWKTAGNKVKEISIEEPQKENTTNAENVDHQSSEIKRKKRPKDPLLLQLMLAGGSISQDQPKKKIRGVPTHSALRSQRHTATFKLRKMVDDLFKQRSTFEQQEYDRVKQAQEQGTENPPPAAS